VVRLPLPADHALFVDMRHSGKSKYDNTGNVSVSVTHSHVRIKSFFVGKQ